MSDKKTIIKNFQSMKPSIAFKQLDYSKLPKEVRDKMKGDLSGVSDDTLDLQFEQSTFKKWIETFADLYPAAFGIKEEAKVVSVAPVAKVEPVVKAEPIVVAEEKPIDTSELETKIKDLETRLSVVNKMILKQPLKKTELKIRVKTIEKMIAKFKEELKNKKASSKKKVVKKSLGGFLLGAIGGFIAGQLVDLQLTRKKVRFDLGGTIHGDKKYKYSITYTTIFESENEENPYEDNNGFEVENEIEELQDILQEAVNKYGISSPTGSPIHAGISFESVTPKQDRDYFEKGIETYFTLHVKNVDGSDITLEETQLIADKLKEGRKLHWDEEEKNWWKDGGEIHSKDTDGTLVFKADTKGGKYSIEVRQDSNIHGVHYSINDYTNGSLRGVGTQSNKELLMHKLIDTILGSKKIDGINYIISHDDLGVKEYLPASEKIWDIYNSTEFREWFKKQNETLTEEQKQSLSDELKNKAIKYVRDNGYKQDDSTIGTFFQLFRKERLIKDFYESKGQVILKDGGEIDIDKVANKLLEDLKEKGYTERIIDYYGNKVRERIQENKGKDKGTYSRYHMTVNGDRSTAIKQNGYLEENDVLSIYKNSLERKNKLSGEGKMENGGGVYLQENISTNEIDSFINYIYDFYGKDGIYAHQLNGGFTKKELESAVNNYIIDINNNKNPDVTWGGGDSLDRERVREYLEKKDFKDGGSVQHKKWLSDMNQERLNELKEQRAKIEKEMPEDYKETSGGSGRTKAEILADFDRHISERENKEFANGGGFEKALENLHEKASSSTTPRGKNKLIIPVSYDKQRLVEFILNDILSKNPDVDESKYRTLINFNLGKVKKHTWGAGYFLQNLGETVLKDAKSSVNTNNFFNAETEIAVSKYETGNPDESYESSRDLARLKKQPLGDKFAKGGGVGRWKFNAGDKAILNPSNPFQAKAFEGFDLTKPVTILDGKKMKVDGKTRNFYEVQTFDGRFPMNEVREDELTLFTEYSNGGGVNLDKDKFSLTSINNDLVEMVIGEDWTAKEFKEHFLNKGYELKPDNSIVGFYFAKPDGQTFQLVPSFHKKGEIIKYENGGKIGKLSTTYSNPLEYLKAMGAKVDSDLNYSTEKNGINYYIGFKGNKALVVAFIEDEDNYMIDKEDAREMSLSAKIKGIETIELYTNYGIELHSKEKTKDIGFDKIFKVSVGFKDGGSISSDNTPKVYIADLAAYNEGSLVGEWLDLSEFGSGEEVMEKISELLKQWSEEAGEEREEYSVHDMENFPKQMYSEGMGESSFQKVIDYWEAINGTDYPMEVVEEFASLTGEDVVDAANKMKDAYYGKFDDVEDFAREYVDSVGGIEGVSNPEQYIDISETDKRIIASEEADNRIDDMSDDDILEKADLKEIYDNFIERADELGEDEELDDDDRIRTLESEFGYSDSDEILEEAKESVREEISSEWEKGLRDPYNFLVEEQGIYDASSIMKANFIMFDYKKFGEDLEQDYYTIEHDGDVYVFSQNYKKGGSLSSSKNNEDKWNSMNSNERMDFAMIHLGVGKNQQMSLQRKKYEELPVRVKEALKNYNVKVELPKTRSLGVSVEKIEIETTEFRPEKLKEKSKTNKKPKTMAKKSAGSSKNKERMTMIQSEAKKIWAEGKCKKYSEAVSLASKKLKKEGKL